MILVHFMLQSQYSLEELVLSICLPPPLSENKLPPAPIAKTYNTQHFDVASGRCTGNEGTQDNREEMIPQESLVWTPRNGL